MLVTRSTYHRFYALLRRTSIAASLLALPVGALAQAPAWARAPSHAQSAHKARATTARPAQLVIDGAGDGHGVGMSQDGALGYAEHGWTYTAILAHYYTGTTIGQAP